ncbi:MAG TPA: Maf family protein [Bacteroidota bacterium]|nr:Maf family protein [Bacteroidota bacterium]
MGKKLILASGSPRRQKLLRQIGLAFTVDPSTVEESYDAALPPGRIVENLSRLKAVQVAERHPEGIVIGADTLVLLDGQVLGKPSGPAEAVRMLGMLSGRTHEVYTGFCLIVNPGGKTLSDHEVTHVTFRDLDPAEIEAYVRSGSPMDKAGAYGIQDDFGAIFVEKIHGCFYNVVGFPLTRFYVRYREMSLE